MEPESPNKAPAASGRRTLPSLGPVTTARAPGDGRPAEGPDPPVRRGLRELGVGRPHPRPGPPRALGRPGREVPPAMFTSGPEGELGPGRSRRRSALPAAGRTPAAHAPKEKAGQDQTVLCRPWARGPAAAQHT